MKPAAYAIARGVAVPLLLWATGASAQTPSPSPSPAPALPAADFASKAQIDSQVAQMLATMKPDQGFMWQPVVKDGKTVAAIEIWKKPGRPAVHPDDAEYAIVLEGAGTLLSGGTMADAKEKRPDLVEGSRIDNGQTRALGPGDVLLVPAGVPHWFGVTGERLILLGMKIRKPQ